VHAARWCCTALQLWYAVTVCACLQLPEYSEDPVGLLPCWCSSAGFICLQAMLLFDLQWYADIDRSRRACIDLYCIVGWESLFDYIDNRAGRHMHAIWLACLLYGIVSSGCSCGIVSDARNSLCLFSGCCALASCKFNVGPAIDSHPGRYRCQQVRAHTVGRRGRRRQ
jgi:hypothetical protein